MKQAPFFPVHFIEIFFIKEVITLLRALSLQEVDKFSSIPGVNKAVVATALLNIHLKDSKVSALRTLDLAEKIYRWDEQTVNAIKEGIMLAAVDE